MFTKNNPNTLELSMQICLLLSLIQKDKKCALNNFSTKIDSNSYIIQKYYNGKEQRIPLPMGQILICLLQSSTINQANMSLKQALSIITENFSETWTSITINVHISQTRIICYKHTHYNIECNLPTYCLTSLEEPIHF